MNAEILTVGTELLLGDILNSNSQFLSRELAAYGIDTLYQSTVGDNAERLKSALETALSRCDMVILTGGLGPTEDDLTRETVAAYFSLPLELHEDTEARVQEYFRNTGREYSENNQKQAMLPKDCVVFPNDHGTAPGCAIQQDGKTAVLLPGPPRELVPMFTEYVAPYLSHLSGGTIHSHTVGVFGMAESTVDERLQDLMKGENPTVAPYAKDGELVLRVTAKAETVEEADALCAPVIDEIRERLGVCVYGVDSGSLQKTVVSMLKEKQLKIATAESCTAGMLSGRLTQVPGVSEVFECGVAAYSKEIKHQVLGVPEDVLEEHGAVSPETAAAMAVGARKVGDADIGIGITGVAGPDPSEEKAVGTVYVALADGRRVWVKKIFAGHGGDDRELIRYVATSHALDMARRYLEALPGVMAGGQMLETLYPNGEHEVLVPKPRLSATTRRSLLIAALAVLLVAAVVLSYVYVLVPYLNRKEFEDLQDMYTQGEVLDTSDDKIEYPQGMLSRFVSLYRTNQDVCGWVMIPDTKINYPVVKEPEEGYYATRDFYGDLSAYGVPYLLKNTTLNADGGNRSLVIYGNNTGDNQMFSQLTEYTDLEFLKEHSLIEMNTLYRVGHYKVFAVMIVGDAERYSDNFDYTVDTFADEDAFLSYVAEIRQRSLFDTPVGVWEEDELLMLTTPIDYGFDGARIVVVARRVRDDEVKENDLRGTRVNESVLMPLAWQVQQGNITVSTAGEKTDLSTTTTEITTETTVTTETTAAESTTKEETTATKKTTTTKRSTTTTKKPSTNKTTTTARKTTTTTKSAATTTTTTSKQPSSGTTPPADGLAAGKFNESEYLKFFTFKSGSTVYGPPANKEELQLLLAGIVNAELGTASTMVRSTEAHKAQAVATYTYILYSSNGGKSVVSGIAYKAIDLKNATHKKIYDAVGEVLGVKLINIKATTAQKGLLCTQYSSSTGGYTSSSNKVWGGTLAHETSVRSLYDNELMVIKYGTRALGESYVTERTMTREELYNKIKKWVGSKGTIPEELFTTDNSKLPMYAVSWDGNNTPGDDEAWNAVYHTNFYYITSSGSKVVITGHRMRDALDLRSHAFRTSFDAATGKITITTRGYGHGVGLSQMGAVGYANEAGWSYIQILKHYYSVTATSNHQVVAPIW